MSFEPTFSLDQLFISPFDAERVYNVRGEWHWEPLERNLQPSGIPILDRFLQFLAAGGSDRTTFFGREGLNMPVWYCYDERKRRGVGKLSLSTNDFYGFIHVLTGLTLSEFCNRYALRLSDELLRYTDMNIGDVARRAGAIDHTNLCRLYRRYYGCTPTDRRHAVRHKGEAGRYRVAK